MLNKTEFKEIKEDLEKFEESREDLIRQARTIIQLSKKIIYALHRDNIDEAKPEVEKIIESIKKLPACPYETGIRSTAIQEYVEALCFYHFIIDSKIPTREELGVGTHEYLLGICDLTGELFRKAIRDVIKGNYDAAKKIKDLVEDIHGSFLEFNLRGGELRKKSDSIKYSLKKLEEVMYDIKLKGSK